jgi:hypothetical protein
MTDQNINEKRYKEDKDKTTRDESSKLKTPYLVSQKIKNEQKEQIVSRCKSFKKSGKHKNQIKQNY